MLQRGGGKGSPLGCNVTLKNQNDSSVLLRQSPVDGGSELGTVWERWVYNLISSCGTLLL